MHPINYLLGQMPEPVQFVVFNAYMSNIDCFDAETICRAVWAFTVENDDHEAVQHLPIVWQTEYMPVLLDQLHNVGSEYLSATLYELTRDDVIREDLGRLIVDAIKFMLLVDYELATPDIHAKAGLSVGLSPEFN